MSYEKAANEISPPTYNNSNQAQAQAPMSQPYSPDHGIQPATNYNAAAGSPPPGQAPYGAPTSPPAAQPAGGYYAGAQPPNNAGIEHKGSMPPGAGGMPQYQQQGSYQGQPGAPAQGGQQQYKNLTPIGALTSAPAPVSCPACGGVTMTRTQMTTGNTTHAWAAGLCLAICLGCVPYCISGTKDVEQKCGNCGVLLATWHRSGRTEIHMHS